MLTKRTNILFDEKTWGMLVSIAEKRGTSVGELVRNAVKKQYMDEEQLIQKQRSEAIDDINNIRAQIKHKFTLEELKESVEYGRKY